MTPEQTSFVNRYFHYVMTPVLSREMRNKYDSAELLLYRSIRGVWDDTLQFDWNYINLHENMFCHSDSSIQDVTTRIKTIYRSYLMNGADLVSRSDPDALTHWINYYAVTASHQVDSCDYDGLFMDSAGHKLNSDELEDPMPWDYSDTAWRNARYAALRFVKSYLPDKIVVFNGLHSDNGADSSLHFTDGGMWEDFAYNCDNGNYKGVGNWWNAIKCMQNNRDIARLILTVKKPGLISDSTARIFSVASYLLISNENTVLTLSDYTYSSYIQYYPEFEISLGDPVGDFYTTPDTLFLREFEYGMVLVNPFSNTTKSYMLSHAFNKISSEGGGIIDEDGVYQGHLLFDSVAGTLTIPPVSAYILSDSPGSGIMQPDNPAFINVYPNPFQEKVKIELYLAGATTVTVTVSDVTGKTVAALLNDQPLMPGTHLLFWETAKLPPGIYYCSVAAGDRKTTKKIVKVK
jgi:hypothetical protein